VSDSDKVTEWAKKFLRCAYDKAEFDVIQNLNIAAV